MRRWAGDSATRLLRWLDPETAHDVAVRLLRHALLGRPAADPPALAVEAFGLRFANPLGLAAGFDKNGWLAGKAAALGFGHAEVGTVTPQPQPGNPRPRVFRLATDRGVINRYGFNSDGHAAVLARLQAGRRDGAILGVNLGANKDAADRTADYVAGIQAFAGIADYLTLNVSSPNTPGLRDLQASQAVDDLLARCLTARDEATRAHGRRPVLLKIAPDLDLFALDAIVAAARRRGVDGMIVSNTTTSRPAGLTGPARDEAGGLSGRPLFPLATRMLAETFLRVEGTFPLVGVGGIDSADAAWTKIRAGASLIQLYSGLVYAGPGLIEDIKRGVVARLQAQGTTLAETIGADAKAWGMGSSA